MPTRTHALRIVNDDTHPVNSTKELKPAYPEFPRLSKYISILDHCGRDDGGVHEEALNALVSELLLDNSLRGIRERVALLLDCSGFDHTSAQHRLLSSILTDLSR